MANGLRDTLAAVHRAIAPNLWPEIPLFARALALGRGVAENPCSGMSFGQHRCQIAARAVWTSFIRSDMTPQ